MNNDTVYRHSDILQQCYSEIVATFERVGGIAPSLHELHETKNWRYCKTQNKKNTGKIGYRCTFSFAGLKPVVKIVVNSFKHGGETATFNSLSYKSELAAPVTVKRLIPRHTLEQREAKEIQAKKERYLAYLKQWQEGSSVVDNHAYVARKNILYTSPLRLVGNRVGYPLQSIDHKICGLQLIDEKGEKRVYGEKKGAFAVLGQLESAEILYLCEGYSTANAIYQLASRKNSFAVIVGVDAGNMVLVGKLLKQKYPLKRLVVCADNDAKTQVVGKGNPGLIHGLELAIQQYAEIKIPDSFYGSDWCDWWQYNPSEAELAFQQKNLIRLQDYALNQLQQFKQNEQGLVFKKALFRTFKILVNHYLLKLDEKTILSSAFDAAKHTGMQFKEVRAIWSRVKKRRFGMALRSQSFSRINQDNLTVIECASIVEMAQHINNLKTKHPRAVFATNAPMGAGKTQTLMQPEFLAAEQNMLLPLIITPMRSLTQGVAERFLSFHYQNDLAVMKDEDNLPGSLAITINSIINPSYQHCFEYCRALFIDEYTQVLRAITLGTVDNHLRQATENKLAALIQQAYYVYIADADLNQIALDHIQAMMSKETPIFVFTLANLGKAKRDKTNSLDKQCATRGESMEGGRNKGMGSGHNSVPMNAFNLSQPPLMMTYRCHRFKNEKLAPVALLAQIQQSLFEKQKIYVVTDSKKQADKMEIALKKQGVSLLAITSDSVNFPVTKAFLDAPDTYLNEHKPDVVIVSPAVQSGISIESDYFNAVFGIYTGTVTPVVFQQMLHRVRAQKIFDIVLPQIHASNTHELENPTAILMASYQQHLKQFGEKHATFDPQTNITHIGQLKIKEEEGKITIEGDPLFERYEKLTADMQALENQQRHYAAQFLLLQAKARGIKIDIISHELDEPTTEFFKSTKKNLQTYLEINRALALCGQDKLSDNEYQTLQIKGAKTEDEANALKRHEIASGLTIHEVTSEDIDFFDTQGVKSIANYKALMNGARHAHSLDEEDKKKGVAKTNARWRKAKVTLLDLLFTGLEINRETGQGNYEKTQAKKARETLMNDEELSRYILFKLKLKTASGLADTAFINKLFKKLLGLKTKRVQTRDGEDRHWIYELHPETFAQLKQYYANGLQQQNGQELKICHQK